MNLVILRGIKAWLRNLSAHGKITDDAYSQRIITYTFLNFDLPSFNIRTATLVRSEQQLRPASGATFHLFRHDIAMYHGGSALCKYPRICGPLNVHVYTLFLSPVTNRLPIFFPQRDYNTIYLCILCVDSTAVREVLLSGRPRCLLETLPHIVTWLTFIFSVCALCVYHVDFCKCTYDVTIWSKTLMYGSHALIPLSTDRD